MSIDFARTMRPREFYDYAARLAANGARPAEFRTAVSRSYYAAYHVARELLARLGGQLTERDAHVDLRRHLEKSSDAVLVKAADDLRRLHADRKAADYNLSDVTFEKQKEALARVAKAQIIMEKIERQCAGPEKPKIAAALAAWVGAGKPNV